ncbi:hypothetical protein [Embleya sp. NPDC059259]|uniref:hypothetical protein n=1 Tax=unclassified Embleya TaxID=2699296 RepID=UPI003687BC12
MSVRANDEAERVTAAWRALTAWPAEHAPLSYASILPPATNEEIATANSRLKQHFGFGLPVELDALWRLCGGAEHQYIENDEQGEVGSGAFLPHGVMCSLARAVELRLAMLGWGAPGDMWGGARVLPWLTRDEAGPEQGRYAGDVGVGDWWIVEQPVTEAVHPSISAYLEATLRALTDGPANLMRDDVPGLVWGCLIRGNPERPGMLDAFAHWTPIH